MLLQSPGGPKAQKNTYVHSRSPSHMYNLARLHNVDSFLCTSLVCKKPRHEDNLRIRRRRHTSDTWRLPSSRAPRTLQRWTSDPTRRWIFNAGQISQAHARLQDSGAYSGDQPRRSPNLQVHCRLMISPPKREPGRAFVDSFKPVPRKLRSVRRQISR